MKKDKKRIHNLAPGTLVFTGEKKVDNTSIFLISYDSTTVDSYQIENLDELKQKLDNSKRHWINIIGLHDLKIIEKIGQIFNIHSLDLEDIVDVKQRPKAIFKKDYLFLEIQAFDYTENDVLEKEQISLILWENVLITFQETEFNVFDSVILRLQDKTNLFMGHGMDYLLYTLIDAVVDDYFNILDSIGNSLEVLEYKLDKPQDTFLNDVQKLRRNLIILFKSIIPLREMVHDFLKEENVFINQNTKVYLHDLSDHIIQNIENIDSIKEICSSIIEIYLSNTSNRLNEIMKLLTIISTIFIPSTFIAAVYGMNFHNMPELNYDYAYPITLVVMFLIAGGFLVYFKVKRWF